MTIELVDGHGGKPHISGEDLGDFKAGILGDAGYVFKRANMLAATLNGSNSITIATGSGIMPASGRHFRVTAPETLTITSGTQGQNRNDLIVVRATTDEESTTVENAALVVLRGTPTSDTATDPEVQEGDLPLYRLQLTGVSVAEPIALFDVMVPYNEFRDSISLTVTPKNATNTTFECFAYPGLRLCFIVGSFTPSQTLNAGKTNAYANVDPSYKPIRETALSVAKSGSVDASVWLTDQGELIACAKYDNINTNVSFAGMWRY